MSMSRRGALFQEHPLMPTTVEGAIWRYSPLYPKPVHFHAQVEFLIVLRGHAIARIGRELHRVHAGQLVWHLPGVEHELLHASSDLDLRVVHAEPDLCADVARMLRPSSGGPAAALAPHDSFSGWTRELGWLASGRPVVELASADRDRLLEDCEVTSDGLLPAQSSQRLRDALANAWRATSQHCEETRASSLVELACWLLLEQPELDRTSVCRTLDVSESYLSRRFQAEIGVSFAEQRARLRVARFVTHVTRDGKSYLDAALLAGFGSYSQLHRVFVQLVYVSPRVYFGADVRNQRANLLSFDGR
jgi:AraC-like DNA-binding protein/mannose-6-phosphate isomerase-like protein (cupin superfamily)